MLGAIARFTASTILSSEIPLLSLCSIWGARLEKVSLSFCPSSPIWPDILNSLFHARITDRVDGECQFARLIATCQFLFVAFSVRWPVLRSLQSPAVWCSEVYSLPCWSSQILSLTHNSSDMPSSSSSYNPSLSKCLTSTEITNELLLLITFSLSPIFKKSHNFTRFPLYNEYNVPITSSFKSSNWSMVHLGFWCVQCDAEEQS